MKESRDNAALVASESGRCEAGASRSADGTPVADRAAPRRAPGRPRGDGRVRPLHPQWVGVACRYLLPVVTVALGALLRRWLLRHVGPMPLFITFYPAVLVAASIGGGGPGVVATLLAGLVTDYWFIPPMGVLRYATAADGVALVIFLGASFFLCGLAERLHRARRAEAVRAARERELILLERFRTMADAIPQLAWMARADGHIVWYNQRWYDYTATAPEQMEGWGWQSVHDPEVLPQVLERWKESLATGRPFDMEFPLRGADGHFRTFLTRVMPLKDSQGRITLWFGTNTDISERKQAEAALRMSEERYRSFVEASAQVVWTTNSRGEVVMDIPAWQAFTGQTAEQVRGFGWMDAVRPEDRPRVAEAWRKATESRGLYEVEYVLRAHDGTWRNVLARGVPILEADGSIREYIGTCIDITERKRAEQQLRERAAQLAEANEALKVATEELRLQNDEVVRAKEAWERTFNSVPDFIAVLDEQHRILQVNRAMVRRLGLTPEQCVGLHCYKVVHGTDAPPAFCPHSRTITDGCEHTEEIHEDRLGGDFLITTTPLKGPNGRMIGSVHVARDITDRKRTEEALRHSRDDLNRAQEVAHTGSWRLDVRRNELLWSDEAYRIFGIAKGTPLTYESFLAAVHPDDREFVDRSWNAAVLGEPYDIEHRVVVADKVRWVCETAELDFDEQGGLLGGFGTVQDITDRKRVEDALHASLDRYRSFLDVTGQLGWITDADGQVVEDMPAWRRFTGQTVEEIQGWGWSQAVHPDDRERAGQVWSASVKARTMYETEYRLRRHDGVYRDFLARGVPAFNEDGTVREWVGTCIDITERKRSEQELRETRDYLENLFNYANAPIIVWDPAFRITRFNHAFERLTGRVANDVIGKPLDILFPDAERDDALEHIWRAVAGERWEVVEIPILHVDGTVRMVLWNSATLFAADGRTVVATIAQGQDITERIVAEESLRKLSRAVEQSPATVVITDLAGNIEYVNPQFTRATGYTFEEALGKNPRVLKSELTPRETFEDLWRTLKAGGEWHGEFCNRKKNGELYWESASISPVTDGDGRVTHYVAVKIDITERKLAEAALRRSNERLEILSEMAARLLAAEEPQRIVDSLCEKVMAYLDCQVFVNFLVDEEAGRLHLNARGGIPAEAAKEIEWLDFGVAICGCVAQDGRRIVAENIPETPDPRTELVRSYGVQAYACHPLLSAGKVIGTLSFGTRTRTRFRPDELTMMKAVADQVAIAMERKRAMEALRQTAADLARSNRDLEQFAYVASHDLQEPLRTVAGYLQLIERRYKPKLDKEADEFIAFAVDGAVRLKQLINDLLSYSRVGTRGLPFETVDMNHVFADVVQGLGGFIRENRALVTCDPLPTVRGDAAQLTQLLQNLIANAIKFRSDAPPRVHVSAEKAEGQWQFAVRDNGIGMEAEYFDRVFVVFQRLHTRERYPGTGIGLAICKRIMDRHGGRIWVESEIGKGSTFFFTLSGGAA